MTITTKKTEYHRVELNGRLIGTYTSEAVASQVAEACSAALQIAQLATPDRVPDSEWKNPVLEPLTPFGGKTPSGPQVVSDEVVSLSEVAADAATLGNHYDHTDAQSVEAAKDAVFNARED